MSMKYYIYRPNELFLCSMVATEKNQIISTLEYFIENGEKLSIPTDRLVYETESFSMNFTLPLSSPRFNFKAEILPGVTLNTNANSVWGIKILANDYKSFKRGSLYEFTSTILLDGLYLLPEHVMIGIKTYDWAKHQDLLNEWEHVANSLKGSKLDMLKNHFDKANKKTDN